MKKGSTINRKNTLFQILFVIGFLFVIPQNVEAQFLKKLQKHAEEKLEKEAQKRAERKIDKTIDKGFDEVENTIDGVTKSGSDTKESSDKSNSKTSDSGTSSEGNNKTDTNNSIEQATGPTVVWSRFDFVPGDTVIFEDGPSIDEENGEFPSRWDLKAGNAEIMESDGEKVIVFPQGGEVIPYLKKSKEDYLPEVFTIEADVYFRAGYSRRFWIDLYDKKNQKNSSNTTITIYVNGASVGDVSANHPNKLKGNYDKTGGWRHISVAFTKGKLKVYHDDVRLVNIPHYEGNPTGITIEMDGYGSDKPEDIQYMKNFRIAKGGVKYYDRVLSEGKIIVNGIKFDVNKATLKPESMGPINKIYKLMVDNPTVNFSVEGHTDSDGDDANNQKLSEARGKAVKEKLIAMGIASNRLKSTGFGESKPIDNNNTPEGKANNRRVEFVKFTTTTTSSSSNSSSSNSDFDSLDKKTIGAKLESLPDSFNIPISNNSGIVNGKGTILLYATSDGLMGKLEILDIDKNNNHKLTVKHVTYKYNGSVHSQSDNLEIEGTFMCDLDKGTAENVSRDDSEFFYKRADSKTSTISPSETTILKIYK